jgi:hypothetical protein
MGRDEKRRFKPNKSTFGLQLSQRLKSEETALPPNKETYGQFNPLNQTARLAKRVAINERRDVDSSRTTGSIQAATGSP